MKDEILKNISSIEKGYNLENEYLRYLQRLNSDRKDLIYSHHTLRRYLNRMSILYILQDIGIDISREIISIKLIQNNLFRLKTNRDFGEFCIKFNTMKYNYSFEFLERLYFDTKNSSIYIFNKYVTYLSFTNDMYKISDEYIVEASKIYLGKDINLKGTITQLRRYANCVKINELLVNEFINRIVEIHETLLEF